MILDQELASSLPKFSKREVLCRCDQCGKERYVQRRYLLRYVGQTYSMCQRCRVIESGHKNKGKTFTPEHRAKLSIAKKHRPMNPACVLAARAWRAAGNKPPNWEPDRDAIAQRRKQRSLLYRLVRKTLVKIGCKKQRPTKHTLGYGVHELKAHLEAQFVVGMSWGNYGAWHVDHIKSIERFRCEGVTDVAMINALSNLRPLWARENIQKGAN